MYLSPSGYSIGHSAIRSFLSSVLTLFISVQLQQVFLLCVIIDNRVTKISIDSYLAQDLLVYGALSQKLFVGQGKHHPFFLPFFTLITFRNWKAAPILHNLKNLKLFMPHGPKYNNCSDSISFNHCSFPLLNRFDPESGSPNVGAMFCTNRIRSKGTHQGFLLNESFSLVKCVFLEPMQFLNAKEQKKTQLQQLAFKLSIDFYYHST